MQGLWIMTGRMELEQTSRNIKSGLCVGKLGILGTSYMGNKCLKENFAIWTCKKKMEELAWKFQKKSF